MPVNVVLPSSTTSSTLPLQPPQRPTMFSQSSTSPLSEPRDLTCGMNDLPTEIKARIVELCAEQDERYKEETKKAKVSLQQYDAEGHYLPHGRSLSAIFQASREFSALAAPYLFKVLKASKVDITLKCLVRRRFHLFRRLHLDFAELNKLTDLLAILPDLPNLEILQLDYDAVGSLWNHRTVTLQPLAQFPDSVRYAESAFSRLTDIKELKWDSISIISLAAFTQAYSSLKVLDCTFAYALGAEPVLLTALSAAINLRKLSIRIQGSRAVRTLFNLPAARQGSLPLLRDLSISTPVLHANILAFASFFGPSLLTFSLSTTYSRAEVAASPQPIFTVAKPFPQITHLSFAGIEGLIGETVASATPQVFPSLQQVELGLTAVTTWKGEDSPLDPFSTFPLLTNIRIPGLHNLSSGSIHSIESFCDENGLNLQGDVSPLHSTIFPRLGSNRVARRAGSIRQTLAYLEEQVEMAEQRGDESKLQKIKTSLAAVESERVTEEIWKAV